MTNSRLEEIKRRTEEKYHLIKMYKELMKEDDSELVRIRQIEFNSKNHLDDPVYMKLEKVMQRSMLSREGLIFLRDSKFKIRERKMGEKEYMALDYFGIDYLRKACQGVFIDLKYRYSVETSEK
jgi:phosphoenolpyruvate synthase/pyruvate phosphate dikinase